MQSTKLPTLLPRCKRLLFGAFMILQQLQHWVDCVMKVLVSLLLSSSADLHMCAP
jgi:hypothetical protein